MAAKILVVDDEPQIQRLILQLFRRQVRKKVYEFVFALSGAEALEILKKDMDIAILLCDINMPGMTGIELLAQIPSINPLIRTVMVSAYGDMNNIRKVMNLGAYDFVIKPIKIDDLSATIEKTLKEVEVLKRAKLARELEEKNEQLTELDELKTRLFTNISHDLRTPLTVITGMADQIEENPDRWLSKGLDMIKRNGNNLLNLVEQILDLRKLELGKLELQLVQQDIIPYLRYIVESFEMQAEQKDIRLHFQCDVTELVMDYDPGKLLRIMANLLSNALKFTPEGGEVHFVVRHQTSKVSKAFEVLELSVRDTGMGIPQEQLPYIFDRFYQVAPTEEENGQVRQLSNLRSSEGSGVGLAIVRELVKLMNGEIEARSPAYEKEGRGTAFHIQLPISHQAKLVSSVEEKQVAHSVESMYPFIPNEHMLAPESVSELPSLLIVEDNKDVRQYLISLMEGYYTLEIAKDGQEGIEKAIEKIPDIIISDVMMPGKNGFELCEELKTDERTSHIPIVLLTAKADDDSRISGLSKGADAYLPKPFNKEELFVRLHKLLELRAQLQKRYSTLLYEEEDQTGKEDEFITRIRQTIEGDIDDETFSIETLSRAIGMSRSQLHRKIKALTGLSTSHFIRSIRVHKARKLLLTTDLNISQIAYEVGFNDPKYFNRSFNEVFGHSPSEVRKRL